MPITQVIAASGQRRGSVRTSGTTCVTSPERRQAQEAQGCGGGAGSGTLLAILGRMAAFDANESLTPFREGLGYGAILFDRTGLRQARRAWFDPDTGAATPGR